MIPRRIKRLLALALCAAMAVALAAGCAPRRPQYPAAIDYELLELQIASLRARGDIGTRQFSEADWAQLRRWMQEAEAYIIWRRSLWPGSGVDILAEQARAEELRRFKSELVRTQAYDILARMEAAERAVQQRRVVEAQGFDAILDIVDRADAERHRRRESSRRKILDEFESLGIVETGGQ